MDKELERRGPCFARYTDDANVYVRSRRAGERVMALLRRLYSRLRLKINETKSSVASAFGRKFLGYSLWVAPGGVVKRKVAAKPLLAFKRRIRELTRRSGGRSMKEVAGRLWPYLPGWKAYFRLAQTSRAWLTLDEWLRHRLCAIQLKHWRSGDAICQELRALGADAAVAHEAAANSKRQWHNSGAKSFNRVLNIAYFDRRGVPRLSQSQPLEPPGADSHAGWCRRGTACAVPYADKSSNEGDDRRSSSGLQSKKISAERHADRCEDCVHLVSYAAAAGIDPPTSRRSMFIRRASATRLAGEAGVNV